MNNWTKYMVHVHHTKNYVVNEKYRPFETRAVRIYDSVDDGLNGLLELVKCEPVFSNSDLKSGSHFTNSNNPLSPSSTES